MDEISALLPLGILGISNVDFTSAAGEM